MVHTSGLVVVPSRAGSLLRGSGPFRRRSGGRGRVGSSPTFPEPVSTPTPRVVKTGALLDSGPLTRTRQSPLVSYPPGEVGPPGPPTHVA